MGRARAGHRHAALRPRDVRDRVGDERGAVVEVSDRGGGTMRMPNTPWRFATRRRRCARRAPLPRRGQPRGAGRAARARRRRARPARGRRRAVQPSAAPMTLPLSRAPMKAVIGTLPPEDENWAYEIKWDGYRTLAFVDGGRTSDCRAATGSMSRPSTPSLRELAGVGQRQVGDPRWRARGARLRTADRASS